MVCEYLTPFAVRCQTGYAFLMGLPLLSRNEWETSFQVQVLSLTYTENSLPQSWAGPGVCVFFKCMQMHRTFSVYGNRNKRVHVTSVCNSA